MLLANISSINAANIHGTHNASQRDAGMGAGGSWWCRGEMLIGSWWGQTVAR